MNETTDVRANHENPARENARSRVVAAVAAQPNVGIFIPLDVTISAFTEQAVAAVARHRLPTIYSEREFVTKGGLVYYGTDRIQLYGGAASYTDRICAERNLAIYPSSSQPSTNW